MAEKWKTKAYNLTAIRDVEQNDFFAFVWIVWRRLPYITGEHIIDVGTGLAYLYGACYMVLPGENVLLCLTVMAKKHAS